MSEWRVVDARRWSSATFTGAQIELAGPLLDHDLELDVPGYIVADINHGRPGCTQLLLIDDETRGLRTLPELSRMVIAAVSRTISSEKDVG